MKLKKPKNISIFKKLLASMMAVVILQGVLFLSVLYINGGFHYLKENACESFSSTAGARKNTLENLMVKGWSDLGDYPNQIQGTIKTELKNRGRNIQDLKSDKNLNNEIILAVSEDIMDLLRRNMITESFIILNGYGDSDEYCGLLVRDLDPDTYSGTEDLLLEVGSVSVAKELGLALDSYWTAKFTLNNESGNFDVYGKPVDAAGLYTERKPLELGYWSSFFRWKDNDVKVMTYSIPLIEDGVVYGVMGISVSEDYMETLLMPNELDQGAKASYMIATTSRSQKAYTPVLSTGLIQNEISKETTLTFAEKPVSQKVYDMEGTENCGSIHQINLYNRTSPFYATKWNLIAIQPKDVLFSTSTHLQLAIVMAFVISIILGIAGAVLGSYFFTKPIKRMVRVLKSKNAEEELEFDHSDVREIQALGNAMKFLNETVRENASKLSQIIELVDLPLGAVEYRTDSDKVFCTQKVITMLKFDPAYCENRLIDKEYFDNYLRNNKLDDLLSFSAEKDFSVPDGASQQWIHFKSLAEPERVLITVMDITQDVNEKQKIEYERDYDILTHLLNRRAFKRKVNEMLNRAESRNELGAMIMWDLDNLKYVNDAYGHDYGDKYIQRAAQIFGSLGGEHTLVGRISGDEFLAFVPECRSRAELLDSVYRIKYRLNTTKLIMPDKEEIALRASGGIAWYPDDGITYDELKRYADFAMYDTKNSYKGAVKEFDRKSYEKDYLLIQGREKLNKLIEEKAITYVFQPIVDTSDGSVFAYEALMRPTIMELASPADVMRLASDQSRLPDIEELTFTQALYEYSRQHETFGECKLFINSIPNQLISAEVEKHLLEQYPDCKGRMVIEIMESEQADGEIMREKHEMAGRLGAEIAIDDFGSGYSSESTLLYMQPQYVKIDISIVHDIDSDENKQSLVANFVSYTKARGMKVIGEGVETKAEMETLTALGVEYLQGYYVGRPSRQIRQIEDSVRSEIENINRSFG
ncbi:EAL domain-containing protein [Ruminococcus sp. OA3]|uniref:EAL domain-containing protein n=1 Tax=Ruminococcus sp. OA3 TaxID=2914164 RepID=UPI001F06B174|nr:EAL domain-containing protein [Ruminococcus sp. OA3]MCH1984196.1 EAL domain-containing protein [Ruminococcus sp. OA3]